MERKSKEKKIKVSLVLSGGGIRGAAQFGALKVMEGLGIEPFSIKACSVGAINGSFKAEKISTSDVEQFWKEKETRKIFQSNVTEYLTGKITGKFRGRYRLDYLHGILKEVLGDKSIGETRIPFVCVAVTYSTVPKRVNFGMHPKYGNPKKNIICRNDVPLVDAILASASNPGAFVPWKIPEKHYDEESGEWKMRDMHYLDGALESNTPLDLVYKSGTKRPIVCINLSYSNVKDSPIEPYHVWKILYDVREHWGIRDDLEAHLKRYVGMTSEKFFKRGDHSKQLCVIRPNLGEIGDTDFHKLEWMIEEGMREARKEFGKIIEYWQ